jgi:hypothetical protein
MYFKLSLVIGAPTKGGAGSARALTEGFFHASSNRTSSRHFERSRKIFCEANTLHLIVITTKPYTTTALFLNPAVKNPLLLHYVSQSFPFGGDTDNKE